MMPQDARGSQPPGVQEANLFETAAPIAISYSRTSISGAALLSYRDAERELSFSGDEIDRRMTPLGELVTVTLQQVVDAFDVRFTLVVPHVKVQGGDPAEFETVGVETRDHSLAFVLPPGPVGVLHTYQTHQLSGVARFIVS